MNIRDIILQVSQWKSWDWQIKGMGDFKRVDSQGFVYIRVWHKACSYCVLLCFKVIDTCLLNRVPTELEEVRGGAGYIAKGKGGAVWPCEVCKKSDIFLFSGKNKNWISLKHGCLYYQISIIYSTWTAIFCQLFVRPGFLLESSIYN